MQKQPDGSGEQSGTGSHYVQDKGEALHRRSLYTFWKRIVPPPTMLLFDAPTREVCTARRETTTTPLQALVLLNDPQFIEAARVLAEQLVRQCGQDISACVTRAFRLATSRQPKPREQEVLTQLYEQQLKFFETDPSAPDQYLKIGKRPVDKSLPPQRLASTTALTNPL